MADLLKQLRWPALLAWLIIGALLFGWAIREIPPIAPFWARALAIGHLLVDVWFFVTLSKDDRGGSSVDIFPGGY